jgi:RNA-directed DNA polymerase
MMGAKETSPPEERPRPEDDPSEQARDRTLGRASLPAGLDRVQVAARGSRHTRFTALLHHVDEAALLRAFQRQRRAASAGVDGMTVERYERDLERNIRDLCDRVHSGRYRPQPVRRTYIPKADGGRRPLGVPALEDKIVQGAVAEVLSAIYEADFLGFSYGFRPRRSAHHALQALHTALMTRKALWVLDADIRRFFDSVNHEWLLRMLSHRIADPRVLRLIGQWLRAGVMERGEWKDAVDGTPQGAGISPLLANVFLHYVLDLWVHRWRRQAHGCVSVVRYADDFVMAFESEADAWKMLAGLTERLVKFGLALHEEKTRLIMFGKYAAERRQRLGKGRPETFDFLGFTHYCATSRDGKFIVKRKTQRKRKIRKLKEVRIEARRRMHNPVAKQHEWLSAVLRGHFAYYGLPSNTRSMVGFAYEVRRLWLRVLARRSQRGITWDRFNRLMKAFPLPMPTATRSTSAKSALATG